MSEKIVPIRPNISDSFGFTSYFQEFLDNELASFIGEQDLSPRIVEAINYVLFPGGKRIRPLFTAAILADFDSSFYEARGVLVALELLHNASLIHDDLPALDNDDLRRGKLTCHKVFGEATALLTGDLLVSLATKAALESNLTINSCWELGVLLSEAFVKLCDGQQLDVTGAQTYEELCKIHELKTGALFAASFAAAGIVLNLDSTAIRSLKELGLSVGLYFQQVDDALDIYGSEDQTGRKESSDRRNNKQTLFLANEWDLAHSRVLECRKNLEHHLKYFEDHYSRSRVLGHVRSLIEMLEKRYADCMESNIGADQASSA